MITKYFSSFFSKKAIISFVAVLSLALLIAPDAHAYSNTNTAGVTEATTIITDVMRAVFSVIVEFIGDILNELVKALKNFF